MPSYIDQYENAIDSIMIRLADKNSNDKLDRLAYANLQHTDLFEQTDQERKRRIGAEKAKLREAQRADAVLEIESAKKTLTSEHQAHANRLQRLKVRAATGAELVSMYAKTHGIYEGDAKAELEDYAKVKTSGFQDTLQDRYAAIRNLSRLKDQDYKTAKQFAEQEQERLDIQGEEASIGLANHYLKQHPLSIVDSWDRGENAVLKQYRQAFKD